MRFSGPYHNITLRETKYKYVLYLKEVRPHYRVQYSLTVRAVHDEKRVHFSRQDGGAELHDLDRRKLRQQRATLGGWRIRGITILQRKQTQKDTDTDAHNMMDNPHAFLLFGIPKKE